MRPFIHVNCAMSADGKIAGPEHTQIQISSYEDKLRVKKLRDEYDAILIGVGTVISDDPHLTVKGNDYNENPIRIVLDPHGRIPIGQQVLNDKAMTIIVTLENCDHKWDCEQIIRAGVDQIDLNTVLQKLANFGIKSILVEGGGRTIAYFFKYKLVDIYTVFVGGLVIGGQNSPTPCDGNESIAKNGIKMELHEYKMLGNGILLTFKPKY